MVIPALASHEDQADTTATTDPTGTTDPANETNQTDPSNQTAAPDAESANGSSTGTTASCTQNGMNMQCTEFGSIQMENRRDIRGEPVDVPVMIQLNTAYADAGARWIMFSARNITDAGSSPVTIGLKGFSTPNGDVITTRVEQVKASELNIWVDVLDVPVGLPISLVLAVGATDRGAYSLETLVLAFDRGYAPVERADGPASLFSFTLLGVNKETASTVGESGQSIVEGNKLPSVGLVAMLGVLVVAAAFTLRRRGR